MTTAKLRDELNELLGDLDTPTLGDLEDSDDDIDLSFVSKYKESAGLLVEDKARSAPKTSPPAQSTVTKENLDRLNEHSVAAPDTAGRAQKVHPPPKFALPENERCSSEYSMSVHTYASADCPLNLTEEQLKAKFGDDYLFYGDDQGVSIEEALRGPGGGTTGEVGEYKATIRRLEEMLQTEESTQKHLKDRISGLESELERTKKRSKDFEDLALKRGGGNNPNAASNNKAASELQNQLKSLTEKYNDLNKQHTDLLKRYEVLTQREFEAQTANSQLQTKVMTMEIDIAKLAASPAPQDDDELQDLKNQLEDTQQELEDSKAAHEEQLANSKSRIAWLEAELARGSQPATASPAEGSGAEEVVKLRERVKWLENELARQIEIPPTPAEASNDSKSDEKMKWLEAELAKTLEEKEKLTHSLTRPCPDCEAKESKLQLLEKELMTEQTKCEETKTDLDVLTNQSKTMNEARMRHEAEIRRLTEVVESKEHEISDLYAIRSTLEAKVQTLEGNNAIRTDSPARGDLAEENEQLQSQLNDLEDSLERTKESLADAEREIDELRKSRGGASSGGGGGSPRGDQSGDAEVLREENEVLQAKLSQMEASMDSLSRTQETLDSVGAELDAARAEIRVLKEANKEGNDVTSAGLHSKLASATARAEELQSKLSVSESKLEALDETRQALASTKSELLAEKKESERLRQQIEADKSVQGEISRLKDKIQTQSESVTTNDSQMAAVKQELSETKERLGVAIAQLQTAQSAKVSAEDNLAKTKDSLRSAERDRDTLKHKVENADKRLRETEKELQVSAEKEASLGLELNDLRERLRHQGSRTPDQESVRQVPEDGRREMQQLKQKVTNLTFDIEDSQSELEAVKRQLHTKSNELAEERRVHNEEVDKVRAELLNARRALTEKEGKIVEYSSENQALADLLASKTKEFTERLTRKSLEVTAMESELSSSKAMVSQLQLSSSAADSHSVNRAARDTSELATLREILEETKDAAAKSMASKNDEIRSLTRELERARTEVDNAETARRDLRKQLEEASDHTSFNMEVVTLTSDLNHKQALLDQANASASELKKDLSNCKRELSGALTRQRELEDEITISDKKLSDARADSRRLKEQSTSFEVELTKKSSDLSHLQQWKELHAKDTEMYREEIESLRAEVTVLRERLRGSLQHHQHSQDSGWIRTADGSMIGGDGDGSSNSQQRLNTLQGEHEALLSEFNKLNEKLARSTIESSEVHVELGALRRERDELQDRIARLKANLNEAVKAKQVAEAELANTQVKMDKLLVKIQVSESMFDSSNRSRAAAQSEVMSHSRRLNSSLTSIASRLESKSKGLVVDSEEKRDDKIQLMAMAEELKALVSAFKEGESPERDLLEASIAEEKSRNHVLALQNASLLKQYESTLRERQNNGTNSVTPDKQQPALNVHDLTNSLKDRAEEKVLLKVQNQDLNGQIGALRDSYMTLTEQLSETQHELNLLKQQQGGLSKRWSDRDTEISHDGDAIRRHLRDVSDTCHSLRSNLQASKEEREKSQTLKEKVAASGSRHRRGYQSSPVPGQSPSSSIFAVDSTPVRITTTSGDSSYGKYSQLVATKHSNDQDVSQSGSSFQTDHKGVANNPSIHESFDYTHDSSWSGASPARVGRIQRAIAPSVNSVMSRYWQRTRR